MRKNPRSIAVETTRVAVGWALLLVFLAMVALWSAFGFSPHLATVVPEPFAAFGDVSAWWPLLAGTIAGVGAAWALAPGFRFGSGEGVGVGHTSLRPWAAVVLGVSSLLMMFSAYWPCAGVEAQFWSSLRYAAEAFEGNVDEPFGVVAGCPADLPQTLVAGVLFAKTTLVLVAALALAQIFREAIDRFNARWARQVVVFSGVGDESIEMLHVVASELTDHQTLIVLDGGPELVRAREVVRDIRREFARERKRSKAIVLALDVADGDAVEAFARSRRARGIQGLYLVSADSAINLRALASFLPDDGAEVSAATEVPGRVIVRVDNPWHAEDWRRRQMIGRRGWLFDALSTREMAARHVVSKLKEREVDYVVVSGATSFNLAVLAELSFEQRLDDFLRQTSDRAKAKSDSSGQFVEYTARTPKVVLVGSEVSDIAGHFRDQLRRFGIEKSDEIVDHHRDESTDDAMARLTAEGYKPALIIDSGWRQTGGGPTQDGTFTAVRNPGWTIFAWDESVRGITDEPLLGQMWMVGPTLKPIPDFGLDVWDRMGAVQHLAYVLNELDGKTDLDDPNHKHGLWESLSPFARESNIRSFATFTRTVGSLSDGARRLGTDLGRGGTETEAPIVSRADFLELAEREHESWVSHHAEYGYKKGKLGSPRQGKRHPDMRPWSELSPETMEKDVENVHVTNALFRALGFILVDAR